jgi:hypothetical protein
MVSPHLGTSCPRGFAPGFAGTPNIQLYSEGGTSFGGGNSLAGFLSIL